MASPKGLSSGLMKMKFMQRSKLKSEQTAAAAGDNLSKGSSATPAATSCPCELEGYVITEQLLFGRMSFKGKNPAVERLMQEFRAAEEEQASEAREAANTIGDEEMADRYSTLVGTIRKKFGNKRKRPEGSTSGMDSDNASELASKTQANGAPTSKRTKSGKGSPLPKKKYKFLKPKD